MFITKWVSYTQANDVQAEERSRYSEACSSLDGPEILGMYWNPKFHYRKS
jgi:hypothetical protein